MQAVEGVGRLVRNAAKPLHDLWFYVGASIGNIGDRREKTHLIGYVADVFPVRQVLRDQP